MRGLELNIGPFQDLQGCRLECLLSGLCTSKIVPGLWLDRLEPSYRAISKSIVWLNLMIYLQELLHCSPGLELVQRPLPGPQKELRFLCVLLTHGWVWLLWVPWHMTYAGETQKQMVYSWVIRGYRALFLSVADATVHQGATWVWNCLLKMALFILGL